MKRKLFDFGLFMDALKQMRIIGILVTVIFSIEAVLIPIGHFMQYMEYGKMELGVEILNFYEMHPIIIAAIYVLAPLLTLYAFSFLNKRSTSDFWHSVPQTRQCIFNVFFLAIFVWVLIAVLISSAVSLISFSFLSKYIAINWSTVFSMICCVIAGSLLVEATMATAMSLTGTVLSNIIVSMILLFLPRIILIFVNIPLSDCSIIDNVLNTSFLSPSLNIVVGTVLQLFGSGIDNPIISWSSAAYTLVLGLIYTVIAAIMFKKRKSESAASSAVNKYLQATFRIITSFIVCLFPIYFIVSSITGYYNFDSEDIFMIAVLYIIALIVYFVYELITTKKVKNLVKAIPSLGILAVLNIAMIFIMNGIYQHEFNYTPQANMLDSVRIIDSSNEENYFISKSSKIDIDNDELNKIFCSALKNAKKLCENDNFYMYNESGYSTTLTVGFNEGGKYKYRNVVLTEKEHETVISEMSKNIDIRNLYCDVGDIFEKAESIEVYSESSLSSDLNKSIDKIKAAYEKDIKNMGFEKWYSIISSGDSGSIYYSENGEQYASYSIASIYGNITIGAEKYTVNLPICNQTPNAYNIVMNEIMKYQQSNKLQDKAIEFIENYDPKSNNECYFELFNGKTNTTAEYYYIYEKNSNSKKLCDILSLAKGDTPSADSRICILRFSYYDSVNESYNSECVLFKIPDNADLTFLIDKEAVMQ